MPTSAAGAESGKNGADCTFTADEQEMSGAILWDSISNLKLNLTNGNDPDRLDSSGRDKCRRRWKRDL